MFSKMMSAAKGAVLWCAVFTAPGELLSCPCFSGEGMYSGALYESALLNNMLCAKAAAL
jgi:hypothetical protein